VGEYLVPNDASLLKKAGIPATLNIANPTGEVVMFKVKTTAPKKYCVKPNSGELQAGENVDVQVMLQPVTAKDKSKQEYPKKSDPPCKDKFLVQSVLRSFVREDDALWETRNLKDTTLWKKVPMIMEDKMKCAFNFTTAAGPTPAPAPAPASKVPASRPAVAEKEAPPVRAPERTASKPAAAPVIIATAQATAKPAASKPSSPEPKKSEPAKTASPTATARRTVAPASSKTTTMVATAGDTPAEGKARIVLLFAAFIIGILMGKFCI